MRFFVLPVILFSLFPLITGCNEPVETRYNALPGYEEDVLKTEIVLQTSHKDAVTAIAFSPDGEYIIAGMAWRLSR